METKPHILYVDDEEHNLTSFRAAFRRHYTIHTANNAQEGIKILNENDIKLVITDQRMPEMTGVQFLEAVIPQHPEVIRMILTGFSDVEDIIKAINTGRVYRYITKPWDENELKMTIDLALESYALKNNNHRLLETLRTIYDNTTDMIAVLEPDGCFRDCNASVKSILGFEPEEMKGKLLIELADQDDKVIIDNAFKKGLENNGSLQTLQLKMVDKHNTTKEVELKATFLHNAPNLKGIIANIRDITEQKRNLELELENEVALRSGKQKEQFLANMSHEIRTPMNAIKGMTNLVLQSELNEAQTKYLNAIKQSSDNLLVIINDILDFSKIEAGKIEFEEIDFRISDVLDGVYNTMRFKAEEKSLNLDIKIGNDVPKVLKGDPVRLNQIILNLVGNAIKFTEKGGVNITCDLVEKTGGKATIKVEVRDSGIGISQDKIASVFESFSQASSDTTRKFGGTGLGLTISKQLVELQGGTIGLTSVLGEGTTFTFSIPFDLGNEGDIEDNKKKASEVPIEKLKEIKILLVEDNQFNQIVAVDTLESMIEGVTIDIADNGQIAIDKIGANTYDIVLMDVQMPVMDGLEACNFIRNKMPAPYNATKIMAMTASATKEEVAKCYAAGMDDFISKPFDPDELLSKIAALVLRKFIF